MHIWCRVHEVHVVLCTYGVVCMLVQVVSRVCCVVRRWCCVHVMHMVLCTCGVIYMSCMWCCVHVVLCTHCIGGAMHMLHSVHILQVVLFTCDVVHTFYRRCCVEVILCTCFTCGTGVYVVLCAFHTCHVAGMQYYVCVLCGYGIVTCVFIVLWSFMYTY